MANDIVDLRNHLFETIEGLKNGKVDVATAKAVAAVASEISKTARLEIDYMMKTGKVHKSEFIEADRIAGMTPPLKIAKR